MATASLGRTTGRTLQYRREGGQPSADEGREFQRSGKSWECYKKELLSTISIKVLR